MKYQARPKWDKNRPVYLKVGFILAISFALMAFNYTSYPSEFTYETDHVYTEEIVELIPRTTHPEKKALPPPPTPIIEELMDIDPIDEPDFTETEPVEEVTPQDESKTTIIDEYASPTVNPTPASEIVKPIVVEEEEEGPISIAERMPVHSKCDLDGTEAERRLCTNTNILESLYKTIRYPNYARDIGVQGTVVVSFVVTKSGDVEDIEIIRDIGAGCGAEVIKAVEKLGKFFPGKHNGRPVDVIHRLPVKFSLN